MLENTKIWTKGPMKLWLNGKPAKVYVTSENVKTTFEEMKAQIAEKGKIPLGIDHLPQNVIDNNAILKKLNLLHVGDIYDVDYDNDTDSIFITSAELTNPLLVDLYNDGDLDSVSIVAKSHVAKCTQDYDFVVKKTSINRVDIVGQGACESCIIPPADPTPNKNWSSMYARLPIDMECKIMSENDTGLNAEEIKETIQTSMSEAFKTFEERVSTIEDELKELRDKIDDEGEPNNEPPKDGDIQAGSAAEELKKLEEMREELAGTAVEVQIAAGKVLPSQKESMVELAVNNMEAFNKLMEEQPVIVDLEGRQSLPGNDDGNGEELTVEEQKIQDVKSYFSKE